MLSYCSLFFRSFFQQHFPFDIGSLFPAVFAGLFFMMMSAGGAMSAEPALNGDQPMEFMVVRSQMAACEPLCPEWISAEGKIVSGSPAKLKKLLKSIGDKKLPILIQSAGGDVTAALAIGRIIRSRKMDVAVAATWFPGCPSWSQYCRPDVKGKEVPRGLPSSSSAVCLSACPFILASGTRRIAGPWVVVGVHQITTVMTRERLTYKTQYRIVNGKKKFVSKKLVGRKAMKGKTTTKLDKALRRTMLGYFNEMNVDAGLLDALMLATPETINVLKLADLRRLNLVTDNTSAMDLVATSLCAVSMVAANCVEDNTDVVTPRRPDIVAKP